MDETSRLLKPTASRASKLSTTSVYKPSPLLSSTPRAIHSSQRRRAQRSFVERVVEEVAHPALATATQALSREKQKLPEHLAASLLGNNNISINNNNNNAGKSESASSQQISQSQPKKKNTVQQQQQQQQQLRQPKVRLPPLPAALKQPTRRKTSTADNSLTATAAAATESGLLIIPVPKLLIEAANESNDHAIMPEATATTTTAGAAGAATQQPPSVPIPRFQSPIGHAKRKQPPHGTRRLGGKGDCNDDDEDFLMNRNMASFLVSVPSPYSNGHLSMRVRATPTARALNVYAADSFHRAEKESDKLKKELLSNVDDRLLVVRRFDRCDDADMALLDVNMDGNSVPISVRRANKTTYSVKPALPSGFQHQHRNSRANEILSAVMGETHFGNIGAGPPSNNATMMMKPSAAGDTRKFRLEDASSSPSARGNTTIAGARQQTDGENGALGQEGGRDPIGDDTLDQRERRKRREERRTNFDNVFEILRVAAAADEEAEAKQQDPRQAMLELQLTTLLNTARQATQAHVLSARMDEEKRKTKNQVHH